MRSASATASSSSWVTRIARTGERREMRAQIAPQLGADADVERGERLVEQQQARLRRERARERDALRLPARQLTGLLARVLGEADARRAIRRRVAAPPTSGCRRAAQTEGDVLAHAQVREEQVVLEHDTDGSLLGHDVDAGRSDRRP